MASKQQFWAHPLAPLRYAAAWLVLVVMRLLVLLPIRWQIALSKAGGSLSRPLAGKRRRIVATNLSLCLPDLSETGRAQLEREHFRALGASFAEMAMAWYGSVERIKRLVTIDGQEHLRAAIERGRGVILFSGHFTSFEIFFPVVAPLCTRLAGMYKPLKNPLMDRITEEGRRRNFDHLFAKESVREMLRLLRENAVVWYASDQSFARKGATLIPFFNEPAMTNTAISRIARISGATVLPYFPQRLADDSGYHLTIQPPLEDFPSDDEVADTRRLVATLEEFIRQCPEQYWWVHQRFKARPEPYPDVYASSSESI